MARALGFDGDERVIEGVSDDITDVQEDIDSRLDNIYSEVGGSDTDVKIKTKVYRVIPGTGELEWCFNFSPSETNIQEKLRDEYGGGNFEARVYVGGKLKKRIVERIAPPAKRETPKADNNVDLLRAMLESNAQNFNQLKEVILQATGKQVVPTDHMSVMQQTIAMIASMKEFLAPPPQPSQNPEQMMTMFLKGLEVAKELGGGNDGGGGSGIMDILRDLIKGPMLPALMAAGAQNQHAQLAAVPRPAAIAPPNAQPVHSAQPAQVRDAQPAPQAVQELTPEEVQAMNMLNMQINILVGAARNGADPSLYADLIMDQVSEQIIAEYILSPNAFDKLLQMRPDIADCREWFGKVQASIKEAMSTPVN